MGVIRGIQEFLSVCLCNSLVSFALWACIFTSLCYNLQQFTTRMKIDLTLALKCVSFLKGNYQKSLIFCSGAASCYSLSNLSVVLTPLLFPNKFPWHGGIYICIVVSETANFLILHNRKFNFVSKLQENTQSRKIKLAEKCFIMENH